MSQRIQSDFPNFSSWKPCGLAGYYERVLGAKTFDREFLHPTRDALVGVHLPKGKPAAAVEFTGLDLFKDPNIDYGPLIHAFYEVLGNEGLTKAREDHMEWMLSRIEARKKGQPMEGFERIFAGYSQARKNRVLSVERWMIIEFLSRGLLNILTIPILYVAEEGMVKESEEYLKEHGHENAVVTTDPTLKEGINKALKSTFDIVCE